MMGKAGPGDEITYFFSPERVTNLQRSYFMEMEVIEDLITGLPEITCRLYEEEGGPQLLQASFTDTNLNGFPPHSSGVMGVWAWVGNGALSASSP